MLTSIKDTTAQDVELVPRRFAFNSARIVLVLIVILAVALIFSISYWKDVLATDRSLSRADLRFARVSFGDLRKEVAALGKVVIANSPTLYSSADGVITYNVKAGDVITHGQILLSIDSPTLANQLQQEKATLGRLQNELTKQKLSAQKNQLDARQAVQFAELGYQTAQRTFARFKIGFEQHFVSQTEFEKAEEEFRLAELKAQQAPENLQLANALAKTDIKNAASQLERQQLVVDDLQRRSAELAIHSPVDGMVGSLALNQKSAVALHQALITVVDLSHYEAEIDASEHYASDITPGMAVDIKLDNQHYSGEVIAISPEIQAGQVKLRLRFTGTAPESLRQNQRISANILLEVHERVLRLPRGTYLDVDRGQSLFKVIGNKAQKIPVQLGANSIDQVEILRGLQEGDEIIISDTSSYKDAKLIYLTN